MKERRSIRLYMRKNALILKIISSYVIVGSILLCGLSVLMYNSYSRAIQQEIERHSQQVLTQSYSVVDTYWASTFSYLSQFHLNPSGSSSLNDPALNSGSVFQALFADSFEALEMGGISKKLTEIADSNPIIASIYIYNKRANTVFSNLSVAHSIESFYDTDFVQSVESNRITQEINVLPRKVAYRLGVDNVDYQAISIVFVEDYDGGVPASVLVFNLKQDALQQMVEPGEADGATKFFMMDRSGTMISHSDSELINAHLGDDSYYLRILESGQPSGQFTVKVDGRKTLINYIKSANSFGWIFVSIGDYEKLLWNFATLNRTILAMAAVFVFLSLLIAALFASNVYKPVRRLVRKIGADAATDARGDLPMGEYEYIDRFLDRLVRNVNELKASVTEGMPAVRHGFLRQLLQGTLADSDGFAEQAAKLQLRLDGPVYVVCALRMASYVEWSAKLTERDLSLLRYALANIAQETIGASFPVETADAGADHIALVVSLPDADAATEERLVDKLKEAQMNILKYAKVTVTGAVGSSADRPAQLHASYSDALRCTEYRLVYGKQSIIRSSELQTFPQVPYEYPFDIERRINEALKAADKDKTLESFEAFLQEVCRFSNDEIMLSLTQLALSSVELLSTSAERAASPPELSYKSVIGELGKCDDLDDVRERFDRLYGAVIEHVRLKKEMKNKDIVETLASYARTHYRDPNLTVERLAEVVSLSSNYVRIMFKNHTGQSLSAFIGELRFREAQRLLLDTEEHAGKIAGAVGLSGGKYFYAAFKKYSGYTPDEYRRKFRGEAQ